MISKVTLQSLSERKLSGMWRSISNNALWISSPNEAKYLIQGYATEMVESVKVPCSYDADAYATIYGIMANNMETKRYVWVYLHYRNHIWKCWGLKGAYGMIAKIEQYNLLEKKWNKLAVRNKKMVAISIPSQASH